MTTAEYEMPPIHPAANLFPMMTDAELRELADDIKANGLQHPVIMYGAHLLDGRNRWKACNLAGVEPRLRDWSGKDPIAHVLSLNLKRRHLDASQRAMVAGRVANLREGRPEKTPPNEGVSQERAAKMLGVGVTSVERARAVIEKGTPELAAAVDRGEVSVAAASTIAEAPPEEQREVIAKGEKEILAKAKEIRAKKQETKRVERVERIREVSAGNAPLELPQRYPVILADPPWEYEDAATRGAAENHYPPMSVDEICRLPVVEQATDAAVLFLWATSPLLHEAFAVLSAWGFTYKASAVWTKERMGLGHWFRIRHEFVLVGVRGSMPPPAPANRPDSVITGKHGEHSEKPVELHEAIERMWPELPRLEMFARAARPGWALWGNQAPKETA